MIILPERSSPVSTIENMKRTAQLFGFIAISLERLHLKQIYQEFREYLYNETSEDKIFAEQRIKELTDYSDELDVLEIEFVKIDLLKKDYRDRQKILNQAKIPIPSIKAYLQEIWSQKGAGTTEEDLQIIKNLLVKIIRSLTLQINRLEKYIKNYNKGNPRKLIFITDWEQFLKTFPI